MSYTVVFAPDSLKGTISAAGAAESLASGWRTIRPLDCLRQIPMADGGEGTLDAFATAIPESRRMPVSVTGPDNSPVEASWLLLPPTTDHPHGTAVVELANTSGFELLDPASRLLPMDAHTRGLGEAVCAALDHGVSRIIIGIGSSASNDGGAGLLSELGACFIDERGEPITDGAHGLGALSKVDFSDLRDPPPGGVVVLSDVNNPLLGDEGSAAVFSPQKGATLEQVGAIEKGLRCLSDRLNQLTFVDPNTEGAGAAGGAGFGLLAWGAAIFPGAMTIANLVDLEDAVAGADIVLTGEGRFDGQSEAGKVPAYVLSVATKHATRIALVAGQIAPEANVDSFSATVSLADLAGSKDASMMNPAHWLFEAGQVLAEQLGSLS